MPLPTEMVAITLPGGLPASYGLWGSGRVGCLLPAISQPNAMYKVFDLHPELQFEQRRAVFNYNLVVNVGLPREVDGQGYRWISRIVVNSWHIASQVDEAKREMESLAVHLGLREQARRSEGASYHQIARLFDGPPG